MYSLYIAVHIVVGLIAPMFFAVLLPITALISLVLMFRSNNRIKFLANPLFSLTLLISIVLIVSSFLSISPKNSLINAVEFSLLLLSFAILWIIRPAMKFQISPTAKPYILGLYLSALCILGLLSIAIHFSWIDMHVNQLNRQAAIFALFIWPLSLCYMEAEYKPAIILAHALTCIIVLFGYSETALLMYICAGLSYLTFKLIGHQKYIRLTLFSLAILAITFVPILIALVEPNTILPYVEPILGNKLAHINVWQKALAQLTSHFPFGVGVNATQYLNIPITNSHPPPYMHHAHNFVLELGVDLGIFGMAILMLCLFGIISIYRQSPSQKKPLISAALISILVLYASTFSIWQEWRTGFVAFALILINRNLSKSENSSI